LHLSLACIPEAALVSPKRNPHPPLHFLLSFRSEAKESASAFALPPGLHSQRLACHS
jgi:hypothetical protein